MAQFAPIVPPELSIAFKAPHQALTDLLDKDNKNGKIFYLELPPAANKPEAKDKPEAKAKELPNRTEADSKEYRMKLRPTPDAPLAPISLLKKSPVLKNAVNELSARLADFVPESITIIVDPPSLAMEAVPNANLEQLLSSVCADLS